MENLSRRAFFTIGAAASVPALPTQAATVNLFKKIERPENGHWDMRPSPNGWKLSPSVKDSCGVGLSKLEWGFDNKTMIPDKNYGRIMLIAADPQMGAVKFTEWEASSAHMQLERVLGQINAAIVQLAMIGHSLAYVKFHYDPDGDLVLHATSTQPFGVVKDIAKTQLAGNIA